FSFTSDPSSAPFSYSHPLPNPPKLHTRISIPKVLPIVRDEMATPVHLQYNSPMGLYSRESAEEQFSQQMGGVGGGAPVLPNQEKHFDATKSKVLQEIQRGDQDHFGESFAEQIARAETPKIFNQQEPTWANAAREKSERARSRTPVGREYTPSDPFNGGAVGYPYQHKLGGAADEARDYAEKSRSFVHANHGEGYGPAYYQVQGHSPRPRSRSESAHNRGYELGGMDFAPPGAGNYYGNPEAHTYVDLNRKHRETSQPPVAGSDFGTGAIGYGAYHGHGPDPPRLRPKYTADPREPVNLYVAPNVDSVDGNLLVGDTLSNQRIAPRVASHPDGSFGTSFAPAQGHRPDHRTYRAPPKPVEPVVYSVSAPRMNGGYSSAPSHQTDVFSQRQAFNDKEVYYTEPNWKRNVDQRKNAWERRAFETEQQLQRPKAPASGAPYWANRSEQMHNTWARAADDVNRGGYGGGQQGGVQHHDYSNSQSSTHNYSTQQSQPSFGQNYPPQITTHFSQPLSVGFGQNQMATQMHSPGGYSVHTQSQSGDKNSGNYATSEHFEKKRNEDNRYEKSSYTHSEIKSTTVNGQPMASLPANGQHTFQYANGGIQSSQQSHHHQPSSAPSAPPPVSSSHNYHSSSSNTRNERSTRTLSPRPHLDTRPLTNHHIANGVETDILNTGFNENQIRYFEERHANPTPHHHHSPLPQKTSTSSTVALPGGGHRYTNFSSESSGVQGGPVYSANEKYQTETTGPNGRSYQTSSFSRSEQKSSSTAPQTWQPSAENRSTSSFNENFHKESNKRSETTTTSNVPVTRNTTYSYAQQPLSSQMSPGQTRYEHYSMKKSEEKSEEKRTIPTPPPPPQPVQESRYEHYSMKKHEEKKEETRPIVIPAPTPVQTESRYEKYSSNKHEETKTESRPVSQLSNYTENRQQDYHKSSNEKTTTTSTSAAPRVITSTSSSLNNDAFDRKAEMSEQLPRGSISNTHNNTQGGYRDHSGHDVSYKRELATSSDPGRDVSLLKEEEKRIIEKPLEPGVISRHVTTKYYKKKTTTDTTTTTTPTN
ncbi:hypothetical protein PENTCL1PPCAC_17368, partial [Pristionchus entomophagus]